MKNLAKLIDVMWYGGIAVHAIITGYAYLAAGVCFGRMIISIMEEES